MKLYEILLIKYFDKPHTTRKQAKQVYYAVNHLTWQSPTWVGIVYF